MANFPDARNYKADLHAFLKGLDHKTVRPFIKKVSDTHFSRVDVILSSQNGTVQPENLVYEVFSNFSSDKEGRAQSVKQAQEDLKLLKKELSEDGVNVEE